MALSIGDTGRPRHWGIGTGPAFDGEAATMRSADLRVAGTKAPLPAGFAPVSRRHIDLKRVAGALCCPA